MKTSLYVLGLTCALAALTQGALIVQEDFDNLQGWTTGKRAGTIGTTNQSKDPLPPGSTLTKTDSAFYTSGWAQGYCKKSFATGDSIQLGTANETYHFSFQLCNAVGDNDFSTMFHLAAGNNFSLTVGTNYKNPTDMLVGTSTGNIFGTGNNYQSFQNDKIATNLAIDAGSLKSIFAVGRLVTNDDGTNSISVACYNAVTGQWYNEGFLQSYTFNSTEMLTDYGVMIDCPNGTSVTFDSLRIARGADSFYEVTGMARPIPEPAAATLGLLGLAGLAFRRRKA